MPLLGIFHCPRVLAAERQSGRQRLQTEERRTTLNRFMIVNALSLLLFLSADVLRESAAFSPAPRRKGAGGPLVRPPRSGRGPDVAGGAAPSGAGTRDGEAAAPGDATARPGPLVSLLDLNGDGRVDAEDLGVLMGQFESLLDVNGDGRVDADDARAALSIFALSSALVVSPGAAVAKGGGHGGGHGGHAHWHGRRHRSGGGHSHYSHDDEYEPWKRRVGHAETLTLSPNACSNLPLEGEVVDVLSGVGPAGSCECLRLRMSILARCSNSILCTDTHNRKHQDVPATVTSVDGGSDWLVCNFVAEPGNGEAPSHLTTAKNIQLYALTTALAFVCRRGVAVRRRVQSRPVEGGRRHSPPRERYVQGVVRGAGWERLRSAGRAYPARLRGRRHHLRLGARLI